MRKKYGSEFCKKMHSSGEKIEEQDIRDTRHIHQLAA
jgi:hypothetical protein